MIDSAPLGCQEELIRYQRQSQLIVCPTSWHNAPVWMLAVGFLAISIPVETAYSWRGGLIEPYYLVKFIGWLLLGIGVIRIRARQQAAGLAFLAAGWGWLAANFWRAVADRVERLAEGQALRLGSVELWFAGGCLVVCLVGLVWSLALTARKQTV